MLGFFYCANERHIVGCEVWEFKKMTRIEILKYKLSLGWAHCIWGAG